MSAEADWIAAGLLDPSAPIAADRRAILEYLDGLGVSIEQMQASMARRNLVSAATDQLVHDPDPRTLVELAAEAGTTVERARRILLAAGFAAPADDEPALGADHVAVVRAFDGAMAFYGDESILALARVVGSSLARIAEAADAMFLTEIEAPLHATGGSPLDVARSARTGLELLLGLPTTMQPMFRQHVAAAIERSRSARGDGRVETFVLAVGFADLVGSTALTNAVGPATMGQALAEFEREAADRATAHGARLVKAIGDEVMVVGVDPVAVVVVLLELGALVAAHPVLTAVRSAVTVGDVSGRGGDYFGPTVNLAARIVQEAGAGQLLVSADVATALDAAGRPTESLGERALRGIDGPVALHLVTDQVGRPGGVPG